MRPILLCVLAVVTFMAQAQQLAFPGAEGFGRHTTGGRNGEVYHVTNLNDSGTGSFRDAVSKSNRIVVFDVSGVIHISDRIVVNSNITVAGQTAPGQGITIYGNGIAFNGNSGNNIIRYIRVRMGKNGDRGKDAIAISDDKDMYMFDHVSVSWGRDGTFDANSSGSDSITFQDCIIGQGINIDNHSTGGLIQCGPISFIRTLWVDNKTRNPKIRFKHEFINSVLYNWSSDGYIMGGESEAVSECNMIGNYFIYGPSTSGDSHFTRASPTFYIYPNDNWYDSNTNGTLDGVQIDNTGYLNSTVMATPFDYPGVNNVLSAQDAVTYIMENAGASLARDDVDALMIEQLQSLGTEGQIISTETDNGIMDNVGQVASVEPLLDTDYDGMPDEWEEANGTDKSVDDAMTIAANGYANIENYINSITVAMDFLRYPVDFKATAKTDNSITLGWSLLDEDVTSLIIEYSTDQSFNQSVTVEGAATSAVITGLNSNTLYYFRIKALNDVIASAYSSVYSQQTNAAVIPPVECENPSPADDAQLTGFRNITLKWENPTGNMAGLLYYDVFFGTDINNMAQIADSTSASQISVGTLEHNTTYYWRVRTMNLLGANEGVIWSFTSGAPVSYETVLYLPFDETEGSTASDPDASIVATSVDFTPTWQAGKVNNAAYFPATPTNCHMVIPHYEALYSNDASFSISLWYKSPGTISDTYLLHKGMHDTSNGGEGKWYGIQYKNSNLYFAVDDNVTKSVIGVSGSSYFDDEWHFITCVRNVDEDMLYLYMDGSKIGETADNTGGIGETGDLIIGNCNGNFNTPFPGLLDELKIYPLALSAAEVQSLSLDVPNAIRKTQEDKLDMDVYPNPFNDDLTLSFGDENLKMAKVQLFTLSGSTVYNNVVSASTTLTVSLSEIPNGVYVCVVSSGNKQYVKKVVKQ